MIIRFYKTLIAVSIFTLSFSFSQVKSDGNLAWKHMNELADNKYEGRKPGTDGYQKAANYVAAKMKEYGLKPANKGSYFQQMEHRNWKMYTQPISFEITSPDKRRYYAGNSRDFSPFSGTAGGKAKGKLIFAGYGISTNNWDDYKGIDVKNKIVLIYNQYPKNMSKELQKEWSVTKKVKTVIDKGAKGVVFLNLPAETQTPRRGGGGNIPDTLCKKNFLVVTANQNLIDDMFYLSNKSWRYAVSNMLRKEKPFSFDLNTSVEIEINFKSAKMATSPNVVGVLEGNDPVLKNEYIVIGGHLDHLGKDAGGFINNGASDNASAIAVILELARVFQQQDFKPKRSIVFAGWTGEEMGMVGSSGYCKNPLFPLEKTVLYFNMDMVGSGDEDLHVGGMYEFNELFNLATKNLRKEIKDRLFPRIKYSGSDHSAFSSVNVPWLSLRSGNVRTSKLDDEHPEYHMPGDEAEYLEPKLLAVAVDFQYDVISELANTNEVLLNKKHLIEFTHKDATVVDLHCDTIGRMLDGEDLSKDLPTGHIDIPKLKKGDIDMQVFACYVGAPKNDVEKMTAAKRATIQIDAVHRLVANNPKDLALVTSSKDLSPLAAEGKTAVLIGIEGGYAIENSLELLRSFYKNDVRLMTLTHWLHTDWADASGDSVSVHNGLTDFGKEVVKEMNRLGMIIDISHSADKTFWDVLALTTQPVVASHSCCRALSEHHRNLSDDMLKALAKNGGMVGINFAAGFLDSKDKLPIDVKLVVDHIDHVVKVTGNCDHVGLGSDYDGIGAAPQGLENISKMKAITDELFARGYKPSDIKKILGGNFLQILRKVCI